MNKRCDTCKFWGYKLTGWMPSKEDIYGVQPCAAMDSDTEYELGAKSFGHYGESAGVKTRHDFSCAAYERKPQ